MAVLNKVLIIDDDPIHNMVTGKIIEHANFAKETHKLLSGPDALNYLKKCIAGEDSFPDVILLDINMPIMTGWEFIDIYNEMNINALKSIPIFMLTSSISPNDMKKADESSFVQDFITKPLSIEKLDKIKLLMKV
jgi:CheY-like chemotaxis protein